MLTYGVNAASDIAATKKRPVSVLASEFSGNARSDARTFNDDDGDDDGDDEYNAQMRQKLERKRLKAAEKQKAPAPVKIITREDRIEASRRESMVFLHISSLPAAQMQLGYLFPVSRLSNALQVRSLRMKCERSGTALNSLRCLFDPSSPALRKDFFR